MSGGRQVLERTWVVGKSAGGQSVNVYVIIRRWHLYTVYWWVWVVMANW